MSDPYSSICGITEEELYRDMAEDIRELGVRQGLSEAVVKSRLKAWYDGYHFTESCVDIYNPFSLLNTFSQQKFGSYWFETGTPTFLVELLKQSRYDLHRLTEEQTTSDVLGSVDTMQANPVPLLYQSGYLTIKGYDSRFGLYRLGFPNEEVEKGFVNLTNKMRNIEKWMVE